MVSPTVAAAATMACIAVLLAVALFAAGASGFRQTGCSFNVNSGVLPSPEPLLLLPDGPLDVNGYLLPDSNGNIQLATGDKVLVACPGKKVGSLGEEVLAVCVSGTSFSVNGGLADISALGCSAHPTHKAVNTGAACGGGGRGELAQIGHQTQRGLLVLAEVCFLSKTLEALYAINIVSGSIGGARTGVDRPAFVAGSGFYGSVDPNSHYVRGGQQAAFATLLGSQAQSYKYIANSTDYYLARGHLVAKAYFNWAQPQRATFYYINAAPQWQTFNGGNWERLESSVRRLATARGGDLLVITGTWGRARLPHVNGKLVDLYINANGLIPVPALYWKVVYDASTREGVAFVGVNNPYTTLKDEPRLVLCKNVCAQVTWPSWAPDSVKAGEGYCCQVDDLRAAIPDVPQLKVDALLV